MADASMKDLTLKSSTSGDANEESFEGITEVREGKAIIRCDKKLNIFYNATQEVNRDISIVGVHAHILREKKVNMGVEIVLGIAFHVKTLKIILIVSFRMMLPLWKQWQRQGFEA